jgi:hypothetical protein
MAHDQYVHITDLNTPIANRRFRVTLEDGHEIEGTTDSLGLTQILKSTIPFGRYTIEAINDLFQLISTTSLEQSEWKKILPAFLATSCRRNRSSPAVAWPRASLRRRRI